jgi:hypothetical protein
MNSKDTNDLWHSISGNTRQKQSLQNSSGNCAPYEVTLERGDILGLIEIEEEELIPLTDDVI